MEKRSQEPGVRIGEMPPDTENEQPWTREEELSRGDEIFRALQVNGITGDVASWLVDLAIRVRRLEAKAFIGTERNAPVCVISSD